MQNNQWRFEDASQYGIVRLSVANLRSSPVFPAELVNQVVLGTIVPVFEAQNGFYYIRNRDAYWGWISQTSLEIKALPDANLWQNGNRLICIRNHGIVRSAPEESADTISDLVACAVVHKLGDAGQYWKIQLPDGQTGFADKQYFVAEHEQANTKIDREKIIKTAKSFLGIPYLWGGTSSKGFDCSGFVQTVFRLLNMELPRNSRLMAELGETVPMDNHFGKLRTGDLLFFGNTLRRITHVALYLGNQQYIHADGTVHINSLDSEDALFNEARCKTLLKVQRMIDV